MAIDPFAGLEKTTKTEKTTTPTTKKETSVSNSTPVSESAIDINVTTKGDGVAWVTIRSNDLDLLNETLRDERLKNVYDNVTKANNYFISKNTPKQGEKAANGQPAQATQAPGGATPPEGYTFKSGIGKNGRPWQAFMPINRNSNLEVIWLNADGTPRSK